MLGAACNWGAGRVGSCVDLRSKVKGKGKRETWASGGVPGMCLLIGHVEG